MWVFIGAVLLAVVGVLVTVVAVTDLKCKWFGWGCPPSAASSYACIAHVCRAASDGPFESLAQCVSSGCDAPKSRYTCDASHGCVEAARGRFPSYATCVANGCTPSPALRQLSFLAYATSTRTVLPNTRSTARISFNPPCAPDRITCATLPARSELTQTPDVPVPTGPGQILDVANLPFSYDINVAAMNYDCFAHGCRARMELETGKQYLKPDDLLRQTFRMTVNVIRYQPQYDTDEANGIVLYQIRSDEASVVELYWRHVHPDRGQIEVELRTEGRYTLSEATPAFGIGRTFTLLVERARATDHALRFTARDASGTEHAIASSTMPVAGEYYIKSGLYLQQQALLQKKEDRWNVQASIRVFEHSLTFAAE